MILEMVVQVFYIAIQVTGEFQPFRQFLSVE